MSYNLLKGKKGIISGALDENSIAWKVATRCFEEGAAITLTNAPIAMRMGKINELAKAVNAEVVPADATSVEDLQKLFHAVLRFLTNPNKCDRKCTTSPRPTSRHET